MCCCFFGGGRGGAWHSRGRMPCARLFAVVVDGRLWTGVGQLALRNNVVVEVSASRQLGACVTGGSTLRSVNAWLSVLDAPQSTRTCADAAAGAAGPRVRLHIDAPAAHHPAPPRPGAPHVCGTYLGAAWMLLPGSRCMAGCPPCSAWLQALPALTRLLGAPPSCSRRTRSTGSGWMCTSSGWGPRCRCPWPACLAPPTAPEPRISVGAHGHYANTPRASSSSSSSGCG
jgi:hypothetical protein